MQLFTTLDATEVGLVARVVASSERLRLERVARVITRLGNGSLYPILSVLVVAAGIDRPVRFLLSAAFGVLAAFAVYPVLKTSLGRSRPCDYEPSLVRDLAPLDHYSCPSGHTMTAAAWATPMAFAWPAALPLAIGLCLAMGWSRVALGHHYVSDVVAGALLGFLVAAPFGMVMF
jgi:undecaprenyl-diphosphatase